MTNKREPTAAEMSVANAIQKRKYTVGKVDSELSRTREGVNAKVNVAAANGVIATTTTSSIGAGNGTPSAPLKPTCAQSSSSFKSLAKTFQVTYGTGQVAGDIITDALVMAGLKLPAHTFSVAAVESVDFSSNDTPFDGLVGLAQSTLSNQKAPTPPESLAKAGLIQSAITSHKISRLADRKNDGEITFGGIDQTKIDPATLTTITNVNKNGF